jgi:hypothetical protein
MTISISKIIAAGIAVLAFGLFSPCAAQDRRVIVWGLDETGSYTFRSKAIDIAAGVIAEMQPGDVLYVRRITDRSYDDSSAVFRLEIPDIGQPPANRFNARERAAWDQSLRQVAALKAKAIQALRGLESKKVRKTDLWGFVVAAADRVKMERTGTPPLIIICSDMQDNTNRKMSVDLSRAEIIVAGFESGDDPRKAAKAKEEWNKALAACNVSNVSFLPPDGRFSINPNP